MIDSLTVLTPSESRDGSVDANKIANIVVFLLKAKTEDYRRSREEREVGEGGSVGVHGTAISNEMSTSSFDDPPESLGVSASWEMAHASLLGQFTAVFDF